MSIVGSLTARDLYWIILGISLISLLSMSLSAGISGDEPVHYQQAEYVNKYYSSGKTDLSAINTPNTNLKYYGQVFDNISYTLNSVLNTSSPYTVRHILNSIVGFLLILFAALIAVSLGGYPAGIITTLFLLLSPRLFGHSLNNLKDIPFALGYIMTIWGLIRSMQLYPKIKVPPLIGISLGFAIAFGTRAGGLILVPIIFFFTFLNWLNFHFPADFKSFKTWLPGIKIVIALSICLMLGYIAGILYWPYALEDPIRNPLEALKMMTHYEISIRQVFNSEWIWSEKLPWYYGIKWIIISSPIIILATYVLHFAYLKRISWPILSLLFFTSLFPLLWTVIKDSNLYGGWRQLLFIYPVVCIVSGLSLRWAFQKFNHRYWKIGLIILIILGLSGPASHIIRNHPVEYAYFNKLTGGFEKAVGKYETDYYFHGFDKANKWLEKIISSLSTNDPVIVATNFDIEKFNLTKDPQFNLVYMNYYNRGKENWDYGIFSSTYIDPAQLRNNNWPPQNTIFEVKVNQVPVCVVIERKNKQDIEGLKNYKQSLFSRADSLFSSCLISDPDNETALLYLGWTKRQLGMFDESDSIADMLTEKHPLSDHALDLKVRNAISTGEYSVADNILKQLLNQNYKFLPAYEQMAILQDSLSNFVAMAQYLKFGYNLGLRDTVNLQRLIRALEISGDKEGADKFRTILNK